MSGYDFQKTILRLQVRFMVLPVDGDVVLDVVGEIYIDIISFPCINSGPWKLSIDGHNGLG